MLGDKLRRNKIPFICSVEIGDRRFVGELHVRYVSLEGRRDSRGTSILTSGRGRALLFPIILISRREREVRTRRRLRRFAAPVCNPIHHSIVEASLIVLFAQSCLRLRLKCIRIMVLKMSDCSQCEYPAEYPALFWPVYYNACLFGVGHWPGKRGRKIEGEGIGERNNSFSHTNSRVSDGYRPIGVSLPLWQSTKLSPKVHSEELHVHLLNLARLVLHLLHLLHKLLRWTPQKAADAMAD